MMSRGMFISFEGIDGSGKSTQIQQLREFLEGMNLSVVQTREPGGTETGERIREILLDPQSEISDVTEMLLYAAARAQLVRDLIRPALRDGKAVLCDRFLDSSVAYQAYGRGLGDMVAEVNAPAVDGCVPDLTFLLDVPVNAGRERVESHSEPDRLEREKDAFFQRVRDGYLHIAKAEPERVRVIDGTLTIEEIQKIIRDAVSKKIRELEH